MDTLEELEAKWNSAISEKEKAMLEAQIWAFVPKDSFDRKESKRGLSSYINKKFGTGQSAPRVRQYILRAGPEANQLWERLEKDMTLATALDIMQKAWLKKHTDNQKISLEEAVTECIKEYDSIDGYDSKKANGKVVRRRYPSSIHSPSTIKSGTKKAGPPTTDRAFWSQLRAHIGQYVKLRLEGSDLIIQERILKNFEIDLKVLFKDLQQSINRTPKIGLSSVSVSVSRKAVIQACRALGMDPPRPGQPVDMKLVSTQRKRYARMYHPDVHEGSTETVPLYHAAMEAYKVLESYSVNFPISSVNIDKGQVKKVDRL